LATFDKLHAVTRKRRRSPAVRVSDDRPIGRCIINPRPCQLLNTEDCGDKFLK